MNDKQANRINEAVRLACAELLEEENE